MLSPDGQDSVPLPGEKVFFKQDGVRMVLDCNEKGHWEAKGIVILSNQRIVFIAASPTPQFQSLNVPTGNLKNWQLEQPWFGANYISGVLIHVPNGGLPKSGKLELRFTEGGAIEFTTIYRSLLERIGETNEVPQHYEPLPSYEGPSSGTHFPAPSVQYPPPPMPMPMPMPSGTPQYPPPSDLPPTYEEAREELVGFWSMSAELLWSSADAGSGCADDVLWSAGGLNNVVSLDVGDDENDSGRYL
ncbi:hypothetical protein DFQ28_001353 [Apophysomyces sp. BC1034]|nr:hypothetical protein DFQ28_001353 [Apophysomyces sp. BC1034]